MAQQCDGTCKMVDTYRSINTELTKQHVLLKEDLSKSQKYVNDLQSELMSVKAELARYKIEKTNEWSQLINQTSQAFNLIQQTIGTTSARLSNFLNKNVMPMQAESSMQSDISDIITPRPSNHRTPTVKRIRPIIRTPNGLMQNVSISLPRVDQSILNGENGTFNSSTSSVETENGQINPGSLYVGWRRRNASPETVARRRSIEYQNRDSEGQERINGSISETSSRINRGNSESPFLGFDESEVSNSHSPTGINIEDPIPEEDDEDQYEDGVNGLSIIPEVTEVEYSMIRNTRSRAFENMSALIESSESSSETSPTTSSPSNKENSIVLPNNTLRHNMSIQHASCSTPYYRSDKRQTMKCAKVVLQPLSLEQIDAAQEQSRDVPAIEPAPEEQGRSSNSSSRSQSKSPKPRQKRNYRIESDSSNASNDTDYSSNSRSSRPKRRATPTSFKEPSLNKKLRRPK